MKATRIVDRKNEQSPALVKLIDARRELVPTKLRELNDELMQPCAIPFYLANKAERFAYNTYENSRAPIQRINVRTEGGELPDMRKRSKIVANIGEFKLCRAYFNRDGRNIGRKIKDIIKE